MKKKLSNFALNFPTYTRVYTVIKIKHKCSTTGSMLLSTHYQIAHKEYTYDPQDECQDLVDTQHHIWEVISQTQNFGENQVWGKKNCWKCSMKPGQEYDRWENRCWKNDNY